MKKALFTLILILSMLALPLPAFAMVEQSESFYVADEADVLSPDAEETVIALLEGEEPLVVDTELDEAEEAEAEPTAEEEAEPT